jgi:predicted acetyltransferase
MGNASARWRRRGRRQSAAVLLGPELCGFDQLIPSGWPETGGILASVPVRDLDHYRRRMPELIAPVVRLHAAWLEARDEWGPGVHEDGFGLQPSDEVDSPPGFAAWVARLADESDSAKPLDVGRVHCTYRWIVEGDRVLGAIALRHELNDFGHIGYGIRPSARQRGLATWALGRMLGEARLLGLDRVLITCEVDNIASVKTIEHQGGVLEDVRDTELSAVRRYWIKI